MELHLQSNNLSFLAGSAKLNNEKIYDVIIVGANPLTDIHNLRRVEQVVTEGRTYQTAPLWRSVGFTP